jgi:capsular polysaccharide transport system permease protein
MPAFRPEQKTLGRAAETQLRVIGATILRELHTRFGRDNIGYLWFLLEPMLLATGITVVHLFVVKSIGDGLDVGPFYLTGYCTYMMFRSNVNRAPATIESNKTLLFHKYVTLTDLVVARCVLEAGAVLTAMYLLLGAVTALGLGHMPDRPLLIFAAMGLMLWFTTGLAMILCAAGEFSSSVERLVHPATYLILPASGMFFLIGWVPEGVRPFIAWIPITQIEDLVRMGEFGNLDSPYVNIPYLVAWCAILTLCGLTALKVARSRMHF